MKRIEYVRLFELGHGSLSRNAKRPGTNAVCVCILKLNLPSQIYINTSGQTQTHIFHLFWAKCKFDPSTNRTTCTWIPGLLWRKVYIGASLASFVRPLVLGHFNWKMFYLVSPIFMLVLGRSENTWQQFRFCCQTQVPTKMKHVFSHESPILTAPPFPSPQHPPHHVNATSPSFRKEYLFSQRQLLSQQLASFKFTFGIQIPVGKIFQQRNLKVEFKSKLVCTTVLGVSFV